VNDESHDMSGDIYDWWSRHPRALGLLYDIAFMGREDAFRGRAIETLDASPGDRVLEVGCGNGNSFPDIRDGVGPDGTVVGLDANRGMVRSARTRITDHDWGNVHAVHGDARRPPVGPETFDAAYASMSLSAVPDPEKAIEATRAALRPEGRLVVLDARPFEGWPLRLANLVTVPLAKYATDWVPRVDLVAALRREFAAVSVSTFNAGSIFVARAEREETT
jgi:demethylmenaquinone methyltransferase/2-methoxy-6-polyprenyl-1,4-benzoquinol methylase